MSAVANRSRKLAALAALAVVFAGTAACATINYDTGTLDRLVAMNRVAPATAYERLGTFESRQRAVFVIASLITVVDSKLAEAVSRELTRTGGDAVINLRIHEEFDIIDAAIGIAQTALIGVQILSTRTVGLEGDVVRWTGEDPEIEEALARYCTPIEILTEEGLRIGHACLGALPTTTP